MVPQEAGGTGVASLGAWWPWCSAEWPLLVGGPEWIGTAVRAQVRPLRPSGRDLPLCPSPSLLRSAVPPQKGETCSKPGLDRTSLWAWSLLAETQGSGDSTQAAAPGAPGARPSVRPRKRDVCCAEPGVCQPRGGGPRLYFAAPSFFL